MTHNFFELNSLIGDLLKSNESFSLLRIDNTMGYVLDSLQKNETPVHEFYNENTLVEGGVFPNNMDYAYDVVIPATLEAMAECDILGFVDVSGQIERRKEFTDLFGKEKPMFFGIDSINALDPCALLNVTGHHYVEDPWPTFLKDKKVLVVSTHCETIKHQWNNIDKIWGWNKPKIAPFELVGCIKSPYHPIMDPNQYPGCDNWLDTVEAIKNEIDTYDYDVLIAGSTTSGPIYAEHAKKNGKVGIQTGGVHQLFFGILGYRWSPEANNGYKPWAKLYNDSWMYPMSADEPANRDKYKFLETNYAYWKK
jgi:hypothetical protein